MARIAGLWGSSFGRWAWMIRSQLTGRQPAVADAGDDLGEQPAAVEPLPLRVGVGEELADVAERGGAEQGVGDRVEDDVGVGVAGQAALVVDPDAAEDQRAALDQPMGVVTDPDAHRAAPPNPAEKAHRTGIDDHPPSRTTAAA